MNKQITFPVIEVLFGIVVEIKRKRGEEEYWFVRLVAAVFHFDNVVRSRTTRTHNECERTLHVFNTRIPSFSMNYCHSK